MGLSDNGMHLRNKWTIDTCYNMDNSQNNYAWVKEVRTKIENIFYDFIYIKFWKCHLEWQHISSLLGTGLGEKRCEEGIGKRYEKFLGVMNMFTIFIMMMDAHTHTHVKTLWLNMFRLQYVNNYCFEKLEINKIDSK